MTPSQARNASVDYTGQRFNVVDWIAIPLLIVGGLNWGLVGLADFDLVAALFGEMSALTRIIYILVGISALCGIYTLIHVRSAEKRAM